MAAWALASEADYRALELRAHALLAEIPLHDVWRLDLPGGGAGRSLEDVRALFTVESVERASPLVRALFALRTGLGRLFGWDEGGDRPGPVELCLGEADRAASLVPTGTRDGPFRILYVRPEEAVSEVLNSTVHAFSVFAMQPTRDGYRLHWAIHVAPVSAATRLYMAAIDPFRRWIVYPALLRRVYRGWLRRYSSAPQKNA